MTHDCDGERRDTAIDVRAVQSQGFEELQAVEEEQPDESSFSGALERSYPPHHISFGR